MSTPQSAVRSTRCHASVTYIGHATVMLCMNGTHIITDPILRDQLLVLRRHSRPLEALSCHSSSADVILLSHMHYDHADPPSLRRLPDNATLVAPRGAGLYLRSRVRQPIVELSAGECLKLQDLTVTAMPAAHAGGRPLHGLASAALGYVIQGSHTAYFAGDTDLFDEMERIGADFDLDLALLPIAGYSPHVPSGHLNPQTAARALTMLRPRLAIPIHWGSIRPLGPIWKRLAYLQDPPYTFLGYASQLAPQTHVQVLLPGETAWLGTPSR